MAFIRVLLLLFSILGVSETQAEETDQFTLPPTDLQDLGSYASRKLYEVLEKVIAQTNAEIQLLLPKAPSSRHAALQLAAHRNETYIADLLYKNTGPGFPRWLRWHHVPKYTKPFWYKEKLPWKTAYWLVFSQSPLFVIGLAPTINLYGYNFGTDKLGHFFMQGHTYYTIYKYFMAHGKTPEKARSMMVLYGQILEQTYLGTLINGVYSNADLAANYAGWKFYMNLTHSVRMGDRINPPILHLNGNTWEFSKGIDKDKLLKPYLSAHLNEALNPCRYSFMRSQIRRQIKKRCADWIQRKGLTQQLVQAKLKETKFWYGEHYGHWLPKNNAVTLEVCFNT